MKLNGQEIRNMSSFRPMPGFKGEEVHSSLRFSKGINKYLRPQSPTACLTSGSHNALSLRSSYGMTCAPAAESRFGIAIRRGTSVRIRFGCPFSSKVVVCGHCLVTLSLTIMKH